MGKKVPKSESTAFKFPIELYSLNENSEKHNYEFIPYPEVEQDSKVILINKFFDKKLCDVLIRHISGSNVMESFSQRGTKDFAARANDRFSITDEEIASIIWSRIQKCLLQDPYIADDLQFSTAKGLNPQLRVYRYEKGHHFGRHYDESVNVPRMGTTQWTLLIYLSGDSELIGGDTIFYSAWNNAASNVHPSKGLALLHKHGDDCLLHEAQLVEKGTKWVLRSDVVF
ncbi:uncharacterized protein KLLA0_B13673g [Kluyveromyces lactis]|uniref:KLLA0B13673p n=1 Tax=Kluyveromyces lactis (strain ATCC 8585 / CBS 2359 / DSM 70799 / NBRC 1267 / NRRL Y-1140 / WM37) TaxID=284590 RepID=Q6CV99_KLULA|nr:uncharacterized protein KLLA0_B13673g [Kluyveromyces lactis]CAH02533.1 KLLA0B13673p [Kluyveromyces lactis]|eukprot:XP_452140.1 uncharacterized protein KLLA0_B13673g [Kluyveromyces lactis]